ncbi:PTS sugar transporter subunit IIC [Anaerobranca gottschalkii]|uniref:Permease IIC component n=1 Tax=Anaerobranca gottschalkii DSM 13577 TaxID=1120990 RepID=A0A1H9YPI6_9FIRM|nr:PTS sugar transporter subunit IIC [Anaerobranca gottschalkii]SES71007.1 PTS system, cellobiose-specific IIC component [Anaerobranca gottschalkii DSM 13577]
MNSFLKWLEEKMMPVVVKVGNQRHVSAMKDGFIAAMPFMIIGSIMLILAFPPFPADTTNFIGRAWYDFANTHFDALMIPYQMTMQIMVLFIATAIGYTLAKSYDLNPLSGGLLSLMAFLLVGAQAVNGALPTTYMDGKGVFTAILTSFYSIELMRFLKKRNITIKMPDGVPPAIAASFEALIPVFLTVATLYPISLLVQHLSGYSIPQLVMEAFKPLVAGVSTLPGILFAVFLAHILWFGGIHGASIVGSVLAPFYLTNLTTNQELLQAGQPLTAIFTEPFWAFYIVLGGSGATFALTCLYLRSKSSHLKSIGKVAILPAIFNINEPIIFGSPVVMNPLLGIPFILAPMVNATIAYFVLRLDLVSKVVALPPWTTPAPIGAMWAANWNVGAAILVVLLFFVSGAVYYPFFKLYEKQLVEEEKSNLSEVEETGISA